MEVGLLVLPRPGTSKTLRVRDPGFQTIRISDLPPHIDNIAIKAVGAATLSLVIETEDRVPVTRILQGRQTSAKQYGPAYSRAYWNLEIIVALDETELPYQVLDECNPRFEALIDGASFPARMEQLSGKRLIAAEDTDAMYGVHGPSLDDTVVEIVDWPRADAAFIRWTAEYDDWNQGSKQRIPFHFEGEVAFAGIETQVKEDKDATPILSHVLPNLDQSAFAMTLGREIKLGPLVQDDRRRWREVFWRPKA
jgi:hypothetical protein